MPAIMGVPASAAIYRATGASPYPSPTDTALPPSIEPLHINLRDSTPATILPISALNQIPRSLSDFLCAQMNDEIDAGDTYPMLEPFPEDAFAAYWFANFVAVMVEGHDVGSLEDLKKKDAGAEKWENRVLGTFYIKPNYTGRSSHVCNAGFLVTRKARGRGVGVRLGEAYVRWAPELVSFSFYVVGRAAGLCCVFWLLTGACAL